MKDSCGLDEVTWLGEHKIGQVHACLEATRSSTGQRLTASLKPFTSDSLAGFVNGAANLFLCGLQLSQHCFDTLIVFACQ